MITRLQSAETNSILCTAPSTLLPLRQRQSPIRHMQAAKSSAIRETRASGPHVQTNGEDTPSADTGPASHAPLLGVRTAAKKTTRRSAHATRWVHMPRRSRRETMTHKRQIRPHGKQTIAVMIPAMPYFVVTSWLPAAHIANTARDQTKSRSALKWRPIHQAERR